MSFWSPLSNVPRLRLFSYFQSCSRLYGNGQGGIPAGVLGARYARDPDGWDSGQPTLAWTGVRGFSTRHVSNGFPIIYKLRWVRNATERSAKILRTIS